MAPLHLHTYPKTFNSWAHLRAFPIRSPLRLNITFLTVGGTALLLGMDLFESYVFENFNNVDFLKADVGVW